MEPTKGSLPLFGLVGLSVFIHGAALVSADRLIHYQKIETLRLMQAHEVQKHENLEFEFVETPVPSHPKPERPTRKISNQNAVNQDLQKNKTLASSQAGPLIEKEGPADQLAQQKGAPAPSQSAHPLAQAQKEKPEQKAEKPAQDVIASEAKQSSPQNEIASSNDQELRTPRNDDAIKNPVEMKTDEEKIAQKAQAKQDASKPSPAVTGLTGQDKITTQAIARGKSFGAELYGQTSFEATGSGMGEYMKSLKEKIWLAWFPYLVFKYPQDFHPASAVVSITLNSKGEITILKVVQQDGSEVFSSYCLDAVQRASSFGPVPPEILTLVGKDELEIKFGFHYR